MNPLFIICIFVRVSIVYLTMYLTKNNIDFLIPLGLVYSLLSFIFFITEFSGLIEYGIFGQKVWWNRYIHSLFYLIFAYLAFQLNEKAYIILVIDILFGILHYIHNYTK